MLDPIVNFFTRIFYWIGRAIGQVVAWLMWPFILLGKWYGSRGFILKAVFGLVIIAIVAGYSWFFVRTQIWHDFDPDYVERYDFSARTAGPGEQVSAENNSVCGTSAIARVAADLIDFNVNRNQWIPSTFLSKLGFFGIPWKNTPFFDNKAAFQLGINQVLRRTSVELVDTLGRVRGTSQIDQNLQDARGDLAYNEEIWYFSLDPFGPRTASPSSYRTGMRNLERFNENLARCQTTFDARADNLLQFLDRVASDIGSTSDILRGRIESSDAGWFDPRADDRFWFAYGQLYAYYGILSAARSDFADVFNDRNLTTLWEQASEQLRAALDVQPLIISNGGESAFIMPSHLATMGFYVLRVRSNVTEMRSILDR